MSDQQPYPSYPQGHPGPPAAPYRPVSGHPRPLGGLTTATIALAVTYTAVTLVTTGLAWDARSTWLEAADEGRSALDVITPFELVMIAFFPLMIACWVVTCLWLHRARTNVDVLAPEVRHARSPGWVWGGWIVPIVSFWFPYQVVRDVLRVRVRAEAPRALVGWWWGLWLVMMFVAQGDVQLAPFDEIDRDALDVLVVVSVLGSIVTMAACVLWIRVVRAIAADQEQLLSHAGLPTR